MTHNSNAKKYHKHNCTVNRQETVICRPVNHRKTRLHCQLHPRLKCTMTMVTTVIELRMGKQSI